MKKLIVIALLSLFLCGCSSEVNAVDIKPIGANYSEVFELKYKITYSDGSTREVWRQVSKIEYLKYLKEREE